MKPPVIPANEKVRMQAVKGTRLLDTPIQERFERITRITKALFNVPIVAFTLVDAERQWFKSIQGLDVCETSREVSFCAHVINQEELFVVSDTLLDERFADNPLVTNDPKIRFYAGYPVHSPDGLKLGSLCIIDQKPRDFSDEELSQLKDMAGLIEAELVANKSVVVQANLIQELDQERVKASVDGLTRLWNRASIESVVQKQIELAIKNKENFGIALIDIDNFKRINDSFGHNAGDSVLRNVAKRLLMGYSDNDTVGRWGGEEFLVVMNVDKAPYDIYEMAERARHKVAEHPFNVDEKDLQVTITTGLSVFHWQDPWEVTKLVSAADKALYEGKNNGKNIVKPSDLK